MWIKKLLNVNIINFEIVDKPEGGGGSDNVDKIILFEVKHVNFTQSTQSEKIDLPNECDIF